MTIEQKTRIIHKTIALLEEFLEPEQTSDVITCNSAAANSEPTEMLTVRECTELIQGLTAYTLRQLVYKNKIKAVRAGEGGHGKILVNKSSLLDYMNRKNVR